MNIFYQCLQNLTSTETKQRSLYGGLSSLPRVPSAFSSPNFSLAVTFWTKSGWGQYFQSEPQPIRNQDKWLNSYKRFPLFCFYIALFFRYFFLLHVQTRQEKQVGLRLDSNCNLNSVSTYDHFSPYIMLNIVAV